MRVRDDNLSNTLTPNRRKTKMTNTNQNNDPIFSTENCKLYKDETGAILITFKDSWDDEVSQAVTFTADDYTCDVPLTDETIAELSTCVDPYNGIVGAEETFNQSVKFGLMHADLDAKDAEAVADFLTKYYAEQIAAAEAGLEQDGEDADND